MRKGIIILVLLLLLMPVVMAKTYHTTLLAVKETPEGLEGSTADLYLEIVSGQGRVFIDSSPLTKIDTQISTRFAKDIACDYINYDCSVYDFFYRIESDSPILGSPSAGGAMAVLTATALTNENIMQDIAMTGTINSGGLIGPISGLRQKIEIAGEIGLKKVLIPSG